MKKKIIIPSVCGGVLVVTGLVLGLVFGIKSSKDKKEALEDLYQKGVKHLVDREFQQSSEIFGSTKLRGYKDTSKKYNYSINLQRYEQHYYSYENLIDYGLSEAGSIANVDFKTNGGGEIARKTITEKVEGTYISEVPSRPYYDFTSWNLTFAGYELSTDSICYTLEAKYKEHAYSITYELDDGSTKEQLPSTFSYFAETSIPNVEKEGYEFLGYQSNIYSDVRKDLVIPKNTDKDVTLTAIYKHATYHITLDAGEGGSVSPTSIDVEYGSAVTLPTPSKTYYTFDCWTYQGEPVNVTQWDIIGDVTLVATYNPEVYSITYNLHGAADPGLPTTYTASSKIPLPYVEKADSLFIGWKLVGSGADPIPSYTIQGEHEDLEFDAIFVEATIDGDGKLTDIADKTIQNVVIPSFVNDIANDLIPQMSGLLNILVDGSNEHFSTDGKLLIKDGHIAFAYLSAFSDGKTVNLPDAVDVIGENAFYGTQIIAINGYVSDIGAFAFYNCSKLADCNIAHVQVVGNNAFENSKVTADFLDINEATLRHIGDCAFRNSKVAKINITSTVKHIGHYAFASLSGFNTINFYPDKACEIGNGLFDGYIGIKTLNSDTIFLDKLMSTTFNNLPTHSSLTTINLVGSTSLSASVLEGYTSLVHVDLSGATIADIPTNAFKGDNNLTDVKLPSTLRRINESAFEGCGKLSSVNFNELTDLLRIETGAFKNSAFTELDFSNNTHLTISDHAFTSSLKLNKIKLIHGQIVTRVADVFNLCAEIDEVEYVIPATSDTSVVLKEFLFEDLNNVTKISIKYAGSDDKLISIGNGAFKNCASLSNITMENCHVTSIPNYCFEGCLALTNASEQFSNLASYGDGAFYRCQNLEKMSFTGTDYIGLNAFAGCFKLTSLSIPHNDSLIIGQAAFSELSGTIAIDYTEEEVDAFRTATSPHKWYHFDDGFSGTITYKTAA